MKKLQKEILQLLIQDLSRYYTSQELLTLEIFNHFKILKMIFFVKEKRV